MADPQQPDVFITMTPGGDPKGAAPESSGRPATIDEVVSAIAKANGVPAALALAVAKRESAMNQSKVGDGGQAVGMFQLHPGAAQDTGTADRTDPIQNITGGVKYIKQLSDRYKGDVMKTLQAYNGGMEHVDAGSPSAQAQQYANDIISELSKGVAGASPAPAQTETPVNGPGSVPAPTDVPATPEKHVEQQRGIIKSMLASLDPRTTEGRVNLASGVGAAAASWYIGGAGVAPWLIRFLGPAIAAGLSGGGVEALEQKLGSAPKDSKTPARVAVEQGGYEMLGNVAAGTLRRVARPLLANRIGQQATLYTKELKEWLIREGASALEATRAQGASAIAAAKDAAVRHVDDALAFGRRAVDAVKETVGRHVDEAAEIGRKGVSTARTAADAATQRARTDTAARLADQELEQQGQVAELQRQHERMVANPPSVTGAAQAAREVVSGQPGVFGPAGPATRALNMAGQQVEKTAQSGPAVGTQEFKDELEKMIKGARPASLFKQEEPAAAKGMGFIQNSKAAGAASIPKGKVALSEMSPEWIAQHAKAFGLSEAEAATPQGQKLVGILGQLQEAPAQISFADAHQLKRLLDETISSWDQVSRKHIAQITKGIRGAVRAKLGEFAPYDTATKAYAEAVQLYRKGAGLTLIKSVAKDPDKVATLLNEASPAQAQALKDLLVGQSTKAGEAGDAEMGQNAWDALRARFTYDHIVTGGIDGLNQRIRDIVTTKPEFAKVVFGDEVGQRYLSNLDKIGMAYHVAVKQMEARVGAARSAAGTAVRGARNAGREAVAAASERARAGNAEAAQIGKTATDEAAARAAAGVKEARAVGKAGVGAATAAADAAETATQASNAGKLDEAHRLADKFDKSTVSAFTGDNIMQTQFANMVRASLGPGSAWGILSAIRLLRTPAADEMLEWAAYSDKRTQQLTKLLLSWVPDRAAANTARVGASAAQRPATSPAAPPPPGQ